MLFICQDSEGKYHFKENADEYEVLADLNLLEEQLQAGLKDKLKSIFQEVMQSQQYEDAGQQVKDQIEWALQTVNDYKATILEEEQLENQLQDEDYDYFVTDPNTRYPDIHMTNKLLDENIQKIRARVQLLQVTESKNLYKAKSMEQKAQRIFISKQNRFEKEEIRQQYIQMQMERIRQKQKDIQQQRMLHQDIIQQTKGRQGKAIQERITQTRNMKVRLQKDLFNTKRAVNIENQKSYERIKKMEAEHQEKLQKFMNEKYSQSKSNYQQKVVKEFKLQLNKQNELDQLEKIENELLERIKKTQQIYQNSTLKLESIKNKSYKELSQR